MSAARDEILGRVRAALAGALPPDVAPRRPAPVPGAAGEPAAVARFAERVADYRATVGCVAASGVAAAVAEVCARHGAARLGVAAGVPASWRPSGIELVADDALDDGALDALDGALTGCALAIAETGTIVLDGAERSGRRALTLLPDLHVCVVEASQVLPGVFDAVPALAAAPREGRPITLVSGPSATSDIELDRVEGVHGPRRLEVLLVDG